MEFIIGCNYWASNAGTDMWRCFDEEAIRKDMKLLEEYGVKHIRAFPNWRDFQPVIPVYSGNGKLYRYGMENDRPATNPFFLDDVMMDRFSVFLDICQEYHIQVLVGLITGWMSGRLFTPPALYGKNIISDPLSLYFQQLFIKGFVSRLKDHPAIFAWDLGNECNCMAECDRWSAVSWTASISNAIRAEDPHRMIVSGMHGVQTDPGATWRIEDQAMFTDLLTTHPYPFWCRHTKNDEILSLRTTMHATAETKLYAEVAGKPCMAEEIGTMGPMLCSNENAAKFFRLNLFSLWANGSSGVMWWCANDQHMLEAPPYDDNMVEHELGLLDGNHNPKPVLKELQTFSRFLDSLDFHLPQAQTDAVCLLTPNQRQWGVGYMTHILLRQAGLNHRFAYFDQELPDAPLYLLPSVTGTRLNKRQYEALFQKVADGADLYFSMDQALLTQFETYAGFRVLDSYMSPDTCTIQLDGVSHTFQTKHSFVVEPTTAQVLIRDEKGNPAILVNSYGKGRVFYVNFPLEDDLIDKHQAFSDDPAAIYRLLLKDHLDRQPIKVHNPNVVLTLHFAENELYAVLINHSPVDQDLSLEVSENYSFVKTCYGHQKKIQAYDACILKYKY